MSWHFYATRLVGDGSEVTIATELPLTDVTITKSLSAPDDLQGTIPVEIAHLQTDEGMPVFRPWHTAIYAIKDDLVHACCILTGMTMEEGKLTLEATGFVGYMYGMPYEGDESWIRVDPLIVARHIWEHLQSFHKGNIGFMIDDTTSPVRIGTEEREVEIEPEEGEPVNFEAGPYRLNWWTTQDVGNEFDNLAELTPFDYSEHHEIVQGVPRHMLRLGYPTLGRVRNDLRFVVGENVIVTPQIEQDGDDYASHINVLGSGEGRRMIKGGAEWNNPIGLRRVRTLTDKSLISKARANATAKAYLKTYKGSPDMSSITVFDHPSAPIGSWDVGDEILIQGNGTGWGGEMYGWFRVLDYSMSSDSNQATLSITKSERTK